MGNALLPFLWCIYGIIDCMLLFKQCNNEHIAIGYLIALSVYSIACFMLSIQQCLNGYYQFNHRMKQKKYIQKQTENVKNAENEIPIEKIEEFVAQFEYFNNLDFSTSTIIGSTSQIRPHSDSNNQNVANLQSSSPQLRPMPTLNEMKSSNAPPMDGSSKSFGNLFFGEAKEMSSAMFVNLNKGNDSDANLMCMICLDAFVAHQKIGKLMCSHIFHKKCIYQWLKKTATCPLCREDVKKF